MSRVYNIEREVPACRLVHGQGAYYRTGRIALYDPNDRIGKSEETVFEYRLGEVVGPISGVSHVVPMGRDGLGYPMTIWTDLDGNVVEEGE